MSIQFIVAYLIACWLIAIVGRRYRLGFWGYFFGSLLLTPIVGVLLLIAAVPVQPRSVRKP